MKSIRNNGSKTAGRTRAGKFAPGNPGRPAGARHKTTLAMEAILEGEAEGLARKAIELAKGGDTVALRICIDRLLPVRKGRLVVFPMPEIKSAEDIATALQAVLSAVSCGELTPEEAASVSSVLEIKRKAIETVEIEQRIAALEAKRA